MKLIHRAKKTFEAAAIMPAEILHAMPCPYRATRTSNRISNGKICLDTINPTDQPEISETANM